MEEERSGRHRLATLHPCVDTLFKLEMMERRGGGFAMVKRERSVRQRFRIDERVGAL